MSSLAHVGIDLGTTNSLIAVFRDGAPLYFGPSLPMADVVAKLVRAAEAAGGPLSLIPPEIFDMADALFASDAEREVVRER